jgi:hypothetical protein
LPQAPITKLAVFFVFELEKAQHGAIVYAS